MILGIGRLHPQKDFSLFIEVAHALIAQHPAAEFVIAGVGQQEQLLKDRVAELGLGTRLRFAGAVNDPRELYAQASVLLLTSRYEGTPMVVLEAMAAGIPVVAPALDGICEILRDGEDAELVTGREPAASRPSVKAPLTGIFYASPAPGSAPYVHVGGEVAVGQVIGLIEAMKLFNEIKSDLAGRVVKVLPESGTLVKAKQPLIEVEPL